MSNIKHTPGPWTIEYDGPSRPIIITNAPIGADNHMLSVDGFVNGKWNSYENEEADAHLIAAAPDMLAALKLAEIWLANCIPIGEPTPEKPLPIIHAAIAKAEGR